jgi:hypothetical protein
MATTTTKGRSGRTRPTYGSWAGFSFGGSPSSYGSSSYGSTNKKYGKSSAHKTTSAGSTAYKSCCNTFERKIQSYKTLCTQAQSTSGSYNRPTPGTLNTFANWINKGAIVQTCSPAQVARWARAANKSFNPHNPTPTACKTVLTKKFGRSTIKAVARCANGSFMVATTPTVNGRTFNFPH